MLAIWVKVRIKPEHRETFLKAIEVDALGSENDEPGCLRFNVLQDGPTPTSTTSTRSTRTKQPSRRTARRRTTPCGAAAAVALDGAAEVSRANTVFPKERAYWGKV